MKPSLVKQLIAFQADLNRAEGALQVVMTSGAKRPASPELVDTLKRTSRDMINFASQLDGVIEGGSRGFRDVGASLRVTADFLTDIAQGKVALPRLSLINEILMVEHTTNALLDGKKHVDVYRGVA